MIISYIKKIVYEMQVKLLPYSYFSYTTGRDIVRSYDLSMKWFLSRELRQKFYINFHIYSSSEYTYFLSSIIIWRIAGNGIDIYSVYNV